MSLLELDFFFGQNVTKGLFLFLFPVDVAKPVTAYHSGPSSLCRRHMSIRFYSGVWVHHLAHQRFEFLFCEHAFLVLVCSDLVIVFNQSWTSDRVSQGLLLVSFKKSLSLWLESDRRLSNLLVSINENLVSEVCLCLPCGSRRFSSPESVAILDQVVDRTDQIAFKILVEQFFWRLSMPFPRRT